MNEPEDKQRRKKIKLLKDRYLFARNPWEMESNQTSAATYKDHFINGRMRLHTNLDTIESGEIEEN